MIFNLAWASWVKQGLISAATDTSPFDCDKACCDHPQLPTQQRWHSGPLASCALWRLFVPDFASWDSVCVSRPASSKHESSRRPRRLWNSRRAASLGCELVRLSKSRGVQPTLSILPCRFTNSQNVTRPVERHEQIKNKPPRIQIVVQGDLWNKWENKATKKKVKQGHWFQCKR